MSNHNNRILNITIIALLIAIEIVLSRFLSISLWNIKIGFAFIPVFIAARQYGTVPALLVASLGDFLGATLFPIGPYFPGFTLTAALTAVCTSLFIHKKCNFSRITISVLINQIIGSLLLNTFWISILYGSPFFALLPLRIVQTIILIVVEIVMMHFVLTKCSNILSTLTKTVKENP